MFNDSTFYLLEVIYLSILCMYRGMNYNMRISVVFLYSYNHKTDTPQLIGTLSKQFPK